MDDLLNHAQQLANQAPTPIIQPIEGRVAYLVNQGHGTANNSTQQLAEALNQQGLETLCMVRPGWPWDAEGGQGSDLVAPETAINGVRYLYSTLPSSALGCAHATLEATVERLMALMRVYRPSVVLSETKGVGLAAWIAATRLGLACHGVVDDYYKKSTGVIEEFVDSKVINLYSYIGLISENFDGLFDRLSLGSGDRKKVSVASYKCLSSDYNVLTIMDEFTQDCFKDEFNLIPASNKGWREQLDNIDFFFAESAWRGNGGTWNYCMSKVNGKFGKPLKELLYECRLRCIPTVFWNKEDPVNYDVFIEVAKLFDYIFTTDASVVNKYKEDVGHGRVYLLKFAAQEKLHAPILKGDKNRRVAFAGSWNGQKYPTRAERLEMLFEYPLEKDILDIYDRYSSLENAAPGLVYPNKYKNNLLPSVPYNKIADQVYKKYSVMINVNSVENSSSMLARRIYELCGCGTPIVSSPANSLQNELSDIVQIANSSREAQEKISRVLEDDIHALKLSAKGVRFVHWSNTYRHRFSEVLDKVVEGRETRDVECFNVTAVCVSKRPWFAPNVARMLKAQTGVDVKVIYVAHGEETSEADVNEAFRDFESFKFMRITGEDKVLADGLNLALDASDTDIVAKIDDDDHYGPNYLLDSCLALQYSGAALVGKTSFFCYVESSNDFALRFPGKHYRYFKRVQGGTLVWSREKTDGLKFTQVRQGTDSIFIKDLLDSGRKVFSSDPFNFVHVRYESGNNHTWAIDDEKFLEAADVIGKGLKLDYAFN